ncbi:hypothetical protein P692DRAFT_20849641 [Suillus brevipes Sb2]|nr:hypothetical protein P692DRAFT_20849641 [Suillus brevipes Sb2]
MYSRTEEERLAYILRERRFRANEVHQPLEGQADDEQMEPTIKLPASFVVWQTELLLHNDINPDWVEICQRLQPGQSASDIPVIVARVFKSRLEKVLHILRTRFGTKKYLIKVIEFQKRGFPHAHIIFKVDPEPPVIFRS